MAILCIPALLKVCISAKAALNVVMNDLDLESIYSRADAPSHLTCLGLFQQTGFDPVRVVEWCGNINYLQCVIPGPDQRTGSMSSFDSDSRGPSAPTSPAPIRGAGVGFNDSSSLRPPTPYRPLPSQLQQPSSSSSSSDRRGGTSPRSVRRTFSNTTPSPSPVAVTLNEPDKPAEAGGKGSSPDMQAVWEFPAQFQFDLDEKTMQARGSLPRGPPTRVPNEQVSLCFSN